MCPALRLLRVLETERVTQRNVPGVMCQICIGSSVLENLGFCSPIVYGEGGREGGHCGCVPRIAVAITLSIGFALGARGFILQQPIVFPYSPLSTPRNHNFFDIFFKRSFNSF